MGETMTCEECRTVYGVCECINDSLQNAADREVALTAERDRLKLEVATLRACLIGCIDRGEVGHNEDCPEDDTCDCRHIAAINAALGAAKPHTCPESDPGPEDITLAKDCLACLALGAAK